MDTDLMKWLNMVWGALDEQDSDKRVLLLEDANLFLEQVREHPPEPALSPITLPVSTEAELLQAS